MPPARLAMHAIFHDVSTIPKTPENTAPHRRYRLPGNLRLKSSEYRKVFANQTRIAGRYLILWHLAPANGLVSPARFGLIASRRSFRRAVDRNRARRKLRECFRLNRHALQDGVWIVLIARHASRQVTRRDIDRDFERACKRAGIWKERHD